MEFYKHNHFFCCYVIKSAGEIAKQVLLSIISNLLLIKINLSQIRTVNARKYVLCARTFHSYLYLVWKLLNWKRRDARWYRLNSILNIGVQKIRRTLEITVICTIFNSTAQCLDYANELMMWLWWQGHWDCLYNWVVAKLQSSALQNMLKSILWED